MGSKEHVQSPKISRRGFFIVSGLTLAGTAYLAYQFLSNREKEPSPLFNLTINGQEITLYPLADPKNIPHSPPDAAHSWNQVNNYDHGFFWILAHDDTLAGRLFDQASDPNTKITSGSQRLEYIRTFDFNPVDPANPYSDVITNHPLAEFPAGHRFTVQEMYNLILAQSIPGAVTVALQTCITVDGKPSAGREINIYRLSPQPASAP